MRKINFLYLLIIVFCFTACGDEEEVTPDTPDGTVSLSDLSRGQGKAVVSGDETLTIDGNVVGANLSSTVNGKSYFVNRISVGNTAAGEPKTVFYFYIPTTENRYIPADGTYSITMEGAALDEIYVAVNVLADDTYTSLTTTTGSVVISNADASAFSFDATFTVGNLRSFDDNVVEVTGAFRH